MPPREWRLRSLTGEWWIVEFRDWTGRRIGTWTKIAHVFGKERAESIIELARAGQI